MGEKDLLRTVREYMAPCKEHRPHQALDGNSPVVRCVKRKGEVIAKPVLGGLHHEYSRAAEVCQLVQELRSPWRRCACTLGEAWRILSE